MNIIDVIPISKGIGIDTLSYFTSKETVIGAVVEVPLRNKKVQGIVVSIKPAVEMKSEIKNANFVLKKIDKIKSKEFFSKDFMEIANEIADYYATSIGSVINSLVPNYILNNINKLKIKNDKKKLGTKIEKSEKFAVQGNDEERYGTWKSMIRQEFAKRKSILFIVPTIEDAEYSFNILEKGVEGYTFILHGSLVVKKIIENWNKIMKEKHPIVIIATGGFFSLQRNDIGTIIIEKENSKTYKTLRKPFLDIRVVAKFFANKKSIKIFYADNLLRIETLYGESNGEIIQSSPFKFRSLSTAENTLVDMKLYKTPNSSFKIFSEEVEKLILKTKNESEQMIILATRRGMAPSTVCGDCQNIVLCNNCNSPVVLHKINNKNNSNEISNFDNNKENNLNDAKKSFFLCHRCGDRRSTEEYCKICGSWKLGIVGIGIDLIVQKIKDKFPDITIFQIDSDKIKTDKQCRTIIQKFKAKPGSILVGTEMMLTYLHEKVENSAIISLDSLFSLPDFRIQERILYILICIRSLTTKHFIVQTRKSDEKVFEYGLKGNMIDFYKDEIEERKKFNYPPFSLLIKVTLQGKKDKIIKEMEEVQNIFDPYEVEVFPAFTNTVRGNFVLHGLIRTNNWPNKDLIEKIRSLSPSITIKVDPETLL